MAIVKVWNDNLHDFTQEMKGETITVPARGFIEMEYEEAIDFKGKYSPMPPADFAGDESLFFKMIRVESPPPNSIYKDDGLTNHLTGQKAASQDELAQALALVRHLTVRDPEADKLSTPTGANEISELRKQVADLTAAVSALTSEPKRGPGRPRKEA